MTYEFTVIAFVESHEGIVVSRGHAGAHVWGGLLSEAGWLAKVLNDRMLTVQAIKAGHTTRRGKVRAIRRYARRLIQERQA